MLKRPVRPEELAAIVRCLTADGIGVTFEVLGSSMIPAIRPGDRVVVHAARVLRVGDVAMVRHRDGVLMHRVVSVDEGRLVTRGDSRDQDDPTTTVEEVLGAVTSVRRNGEEVRFGSGRWARLRRSWTLLRDTFRRRSR